jgi:hypothetical protein
MPDKPMWYGRLDAVISNLKMLPYPWVDRAMLEQLLGVGRRRAQQILAPCVTHTVGANGLADREQLIAHLEHLAAGDAADYERRRRQKLAGEIARLRQAWIDHPRVLVDAPSRIVSQTFAGLLGVTVSPGRIVVDFATPNEALEKLLALAMAIGNDSEAFERLASKTQIQDRFPTP